MSGQTVIVDGATNETAKVDGQRRVWTRATTVTTGLNAGINEDQYAINPSAVTLTTDTESVLVYIRNDETENVDWALSQITVVGAESNGSGDWLAAMYANVNTGTLIDSGGDGVAIPFNLGSNKPLSATIKTGIEGSALNGTPPLDRLVPTAPASFIIPLDAIVMPPGTSAAISVTPPTGNTSMKVQIELIIIRLPENGE